MNLETNATTHGTGSQLARPNMGGVMGKYPSMFGRAYVYLPDVEYSHPYKEGPLLPLEGWLHTLVAPELMTTTKNGVDSNQTVTT